MLLKSKTILFLLLLVVVVGAVVLVLTAPATDTSKNKEQAGGGEQASEQVPVASQPTSLPPTEPPPPLTIQSVERQFEVLSVVQPDTFRVRDIISKDELELFVPSDAQITAGSRQNIGQGALVTVTRLMTVSNGIVATELTVATVQ